MAARVQNAPETRARLEPSANLSSVTWDGRRYSYMPSAPLRVSEKLRIADASTSSDPVTYEVLRWRLWGLNLEHADTIRRISGTRVIVYMEDFVTALLTARGDTVVSSPTLQYFSGMADLVVKWTLENRSENPGIEDGDVFLQNDPYIGTTHQMDTAMYAPVFWEGELIAWVFNSCHVGDLGGITPGSFCTGANDIYDEPLPIPPVKIARGGSLQSDVAELFVRQGRTPEMIALQLRSQFAGVQATRKRLLEIVARYGPDVVNGAMCAVIDDAAEVVGRRLAQIPDGVWRSAVHFGGLAFDPTKVHRIVTTVRKVGNQLICSNEGTDPQVKSGNCTFAAWRSGLVCAVANQLAYDQQGCPAGVVRHMKFEPTPGTLNCAVFPAAVSSLTANNMSLASAGHALSQMLLSGPAELAENAFSIGTGVSGFWLYSWVDGEGRSCSDLTGDPNAAAAGASVARDGVDQGGGWFMPTCTAGDIEEWEDSMPLLYLYRRDAMDSGGPGQFRGGNGLACGYVTNGGESAAAQAIGSDASVLATLGLAGGTPGAPGSFRFASDVNMRERLAKARTPDVLRSIEPEGGAFTRLFGGSVTPMGPDGVVMANFAGAGGFGDPLQRNVEQIEADLRLALVSPDFAASAYGVSFGEDGAIDLEATARRREGLRSERLAESEAPRAPQSASLAGVQIIHSAGGQLLVARAPGSATENLFWACRTCRAGLGPLDQNYKDGCRSIVRRVSNGTSAQDRDYGMVARRYICPGCGVSIAYEIGRESDPPLRDIELDPGSLQVCAHPPGVGRPTTGDDLDPLA
jgi:N-methylhydantoinase B